jgi:GNAT superfamily N-acetyltransferase
MHVRQATVADAAGIARVQERSWRAGYAHVFPPDAWERLHIDPERWRARLAEPRPQSATFVAVDDGEVSGFTAVGPSQDEEGAGELYAIYVDPRRWGSGLGRALLERAEAQLTATGFVEATLWVLDDNPRARRFYEAAGWYLDGATKNEEHIGVRVGEVRYRKRL